MGLVNKIPAKYLGPLLILLGLLPLLVYATQIRQLLFPRATYTGIPSRVLVSPGQVQMDVVSNISLYLSAQAVDTGDSDIRTGVTYVWGISSTNSVGDLIVKDNTAIASFIAKNTGLGDIWVKAITSSGQATSSIPVCIGMPCPTTVYTSPTPSPTSPNVAIIKRVAVLNFNPTVNTSTGQRLIEYRNWNLPQNLENQLISDLKAVSHNFLDYQIVSRQDIDGFPAKADSFNYTPTAYLNCLGHSSACHQPDTVNYAKILSDYGICDKVNANQIDELWLWGGPYFGYWEANMAGPTAFWTNGPIVAGTTCQRNIHIMGFNYERGVPEMLESFGHRTEGTLKQVYGSWTAGSSSHTWNKFTLLDKYVPGQAGCGNVHFAPNSQSDYDWGNTRTVTSSCEDWLNYPNLTSATQQITCSRWNCNNYGYLKWWFTHLPHVPGLGPDGKLANWWDYIVNYPPSSPTPTPSATPLPSPVPTPPSGCYYQQVQCIQAPCNPILVCPSPTPIPSPTPTAPACDLPSIPPASGPAPLNILLHGGGSTTNSNNSVLGYLWDFEGDGTFDTTTPQIDPILHTYSSPGVFHPVYQVVAQDGQTSPNCLYPYAVIVTTPTPTIIQGDLNQNGHVDIFDYNILVAEFGKIGNSMADINTNGKVDIFDYNILVANFGK